MTNETTLLKSLITGQTVKSEFQPQNNKQAYLAYLNGLDIALPEPRTVEEVLLYNLCANGVGGGGSGSSVTITDASYLFYSNTRLDNINGILGLLKGVKKTKQMFYNCTQLTTVPTIDLSVCEDADMMFQNCSKMGGTIDLKGARLKKFQFMFDGCVKLEGILNFFVNSTTAYSASSFIPRGTSSSPAALKRFTFAPGNTYTAFAGLNFSYCSFDRAGAVEMFNSLKTVTSPGGSYNQIILTGNPCITNGTLTAADKAIATDKGWTIVEG